MVTVGDLISKKDYDYIEFRGILDKPLKNGITDYFAGGAASKNGELIFRNENDEYPKNTEVVRHIEWDDPEEKIKSGLTVYCKNF